MKQSWVWGLLLTVGLFAACADGDDTAANAPKETTDAGGDENLPSLSFADGSTSDAMPAPIRTNYPCAGCVPFPPAGAPACPALAPAKLVYPGRGVLFPPNLNVLEVQFTPPPGATLFEVDFTNAITDVRVETKCVPVPNVRGGASLGCGVQIPLAAWKDVANQNRGHDAVNVSVRATTDAKCVSTSNVADINFADEDLAGGIYYWQSAVFGGAAGRTGGIYSHDFGTADPTPTPFYTSGTEGTCVGCHNLSRDGARISLGVDDPDSDDEFGDVSTNVMDVKTRASLGQSLSPGFQAWTHDHSRLVASDYSGEDRSFGVFDSDGNSLATWALPADLRGTQPDVSADDKNLVFVSPKSGTISSYGDHHFMGGSLYVANINFASNAMGTPNLTLPATGNEAFYYPSFSPDGHFLIFNHAPDGDVFYNRNARVQIMRFPVAAGVKPVDLPALNVSDGLTNSWPRWSPFVTRYKGRKLLWVTFSSNRDYGLHIVNKGFDNCYPSYSPDYDQPQIAYGDANAFANCAQPQIWMAGVNVEGAGEFDAEDRSYAAFWLPFQDVSSHNHSAQWVEKVQSSGSDAGTCGASGATCNASAPCCSDFVCCRGRCATSCIQ